MNVVFLGSGEFAVPILERLSRRADEHPIVRVVTRPDRPAGRKKRLRPTPVRQRAAELGLACDAPESTADPGYLEQLRALEAPLFVVADYGEILRQTLLDLPRIGVFNLHGSVLPAYRGAAPVARAILGGETDTGVTLFRVERALDSGPVVAIARTSIGETETAGELEERLAELAARLVDDHLDAFAAGEFDEVPQDHDSATYAPKIAKAEARIDWAQGAARVARRILALSPAPGAYGFLHREGRPPERTVLHRARVAAADSDDATLSPGTVALPEPGRLVVGCGSGAIEILELQRSGKARLTAVDYLRGQRLQGGEHFAAEE